MRILGVDPGLQITGYAMISVPSESPDIGRIKVLEAGVIRPGNPRRGIAERLRNVHDSLSELMTQFRPDVLVIEKLFAHYEHPATAILMGHVRGVVCLLGGTKGVPLVSVPATHVKKALTGRGHAPKKQVQRMTQHLLGLKELPEPPDAADALAAAIAYVFSMKSKRRLG